MAEDSNYEADVYAPGYIDQLDNNAELIRRAAEYEMGQTTYYDGLIEQAPEVMDDNRIRSERELLRQVRDYHQENCDLMGGMYENLTGNRLDLGRTGRFEAPTRYMRGIERGIYDGVGQVDRYQNIYDNFGYRDNYYRGQVTNAITNTLQAALLLNLIYNVGRARY